MIKLIIFDLDGVLVSSRDDHYHAFNYALEKVLGKNWIIPYEEHLSTYDGLSTKKKLKLLTDKKKLDKDKYDIIWKYKQEYTKELVNNYQYDERIRLILKQLQEKGYKIYVASNSIWKSICLILLRKGFLEYIDYFISNEDVNEPKPSPEIYWKCMIRAKIRSDETLIIEDSHIGRRSALLSGAHLLSVSNPNEVTLENIHSKIQSLPIDNKILTPWKGKCNVLIPMAGRGSRFANAGYTFPKPLIDVNGKPMIQLVIESLHIDVKRSNYIFVVQKEHYEKYNLKHFLNLLAPNCKIIQIDYITNGAAETCLLAKDYMNPDLPLVIANSDQYVEWNTNEFMYSMETDGIDAGILCFKNTHPKYSYVKLTKEGFVSEVAEKKVISDIATVGIYYYKKAIDFIKYTEQMIKKNIRHNNEFYVCPVFNEFIKDGCKIKIQYCQKMYGLGTPEDLQEYLRLSN